MNSSVKRKVHLKFSLYKSFSPNLIFLPIPSSSAICFISLKEPPYCHYQSNLVKQLKFIGCEEEEEIKNFALINFPKHNVESGKD
jgi:hypothetical protein